MTDTGEASVGGMGLVTKSVAVLQALAASGELTVGQLSDATGEPVSSLYRLLSSLDAIGWVEQGSKRGKFRLGLDFLWLGARLEAQLDVRRLALPELTRLHEATGETVFLCIRRGMSAVCIERIDGRDVQIHSLRLGESLPLGEGVAPRAILAFESPDFVARYLRDAASRAPVSAIAPDREQLVRLLDETAASGVAVAEADWVDGIGGVGAPIFDHKGHVVAALSISGLSGRLFSGDIDVVALVTQAARAVSLKLGSESFTGRVNRGQANSAASQEQ
ncbi:IclR family transcriptional regulator [Paenarthrobacter nitroguajacolicus]|uniref:IclR family transcriptional regulator n=1 Tax=Paenarthrobacter nitroguajacolicus TaxID=211146 RepID=A0A558GWL3_PAENT|nr:IclR family transcriptional regulator [Paenarthrobacter nitroguajacolicus]TVU61272.1 IclR family transcriptional regulator [Paenarthrobacter nitroguajacolicus]